MTLTRFAGKPMHALRIATIVANIDKAGAV